MTISNINPYNNYSGNGHTTTFDFDFLINEGAELLVVLTNANGMQQTLIQDSDYCINVDVDGNFSGSITYPIENSTHQILSDDEIISLSLNLDIEQEKEFKNSSKLNLATLEWSFDYLTRLAQILNRKVERSVKIQEGSSITPDEMLEDIKTAQNTCETSAQNCETSATVCENAADTILRNVQTDWNETDNTLGTFIKNKPVIPVVPSISHLANKDLSNLSTTGEARFSAKANADLSNVTAISSYIVETYKNGYNWYVLYSDGWIEQGGKYQFPNGAISTITFLKPFTTNNVNLLSSLNTYFNGTGIYLSEFGYNPTATYFQCNGHSNRIYSWRACGY